MLVCLDVVVQILLLILKSPQILVQIYSDLKLFTGFASAALTD
jgi:hypothetical protein